MFSIRSGGGGLTMPKRVVVGTSRNHSVLDMLAAARKTATPLVEHQAPHPADVPETLASITAAEAQLGWQPRIFFPDEPDS